MLRKRRKLGQNCNWRLETKSISFYIFLNFWSNFCLLNTVHSYLLRLETEFASTPKIKMLRLQWNFTILFGTFENLYFGHATLFISKWNLLLICVYYLLRMVNTILILHRFMRAIKAFYIFQIFQIVHFGQMAKDQKVALRCWVAVRIRKLKLLNSFAKIAEFLLNKLKFTLLTCLDFRILFALDFGLKLLCFSRQLLLFLVKCLKFCANKVRGIYKV